MSESTYDLSGARKVFSRIGWAMCEILVITTILQILCAEVLSPLWGEDHWLNTSWGMWLGSVGPLYVIAIPVSLLIMRKLPAQRPEDNKLGGKNFLVFLPICFFLMYSGNIIGTLLSFVFSGGMAQNELLDFVMDNSPLKVLVMVILAPMLEEYVCRKQIIDRTRQYGEKTAVFLSALVFGLLHQNLFQFFYAFALGLVFAYIYIRTGRLRYTILLHGIVNFMGSVVAPWILSLVDMETLAGLDPNASIDEIMALYAEILPGLAVYMLYVLLLIGLSIAGLVLLIIKCKQLIWKEAESQLPKGTCVKTVYWNVGMVLYILLCIIAVVISLFGGI